MFACACACVCVCLCVCVCVCVCVCAALIKLQPVMYCQSKSVSGLSVCAFVSVVVDGYFLEGWSGGGEIQVAILNVCQSCFPPFHMHILIASRCSKPEMPSCREPTA